MTESSRPDDYTQVSAHLRAAGQEVTELLDLLSDGLATEKQIRTNSGGATTGDDGQHTLSPRAGEPR